MATITQEMWRVMRGHSEISPECPAAMVANLLVSGDSPTELPPSTAPSEPALDLGLLFDIFGDFDPSFVNNNISDLSLLDAAASTTTAAQRKRALDNESDGGDTSYEVATSSQTKPRQKKPRRPTHIMVKETREKLYAQLQHLELQAALLRQQAGVEDPQVVAAKNALNLHLRDAVLQHDLQVASTQAAFGGYLNSRATSPLESYIHLGTNWNQRRGVLKEMKDRKIQVAHQFLLERTRHMNPFKPSREASTFETEQGDMCAVTVDITPFQGATSVLEVFKVLQFYFANMEISQTELSGKVTIRENEASVDNSMMQHRIVTSEEGGVLQESNVVVFYDVSGLNTENKVEQCVIMTGDSVDRDDLYPYRPHERLRKDASSAMKLSAHRRRRPRSTSRAGAVGGTSTVGDAEQQGGKYDDGDEEEEEFVVVLTRAFFVRLHRSEVDVPKQVLQTISDDMTDCIDAMLKSTQSGLRQMNGQHNT